MIAGNLFKPIVSVVIPAFNEEKNIADVLERTCRAVELSALPFEIIVVDDGSKDRTREIAFGHKAVVLWNETNQGKGAALRKGISQAEGEVVVTMDADGSHDPEDIPRLVEPILRGATMTIGTRFSTDEGKKSTSKVNLVGNKIINFSIFLLTGRRVTDSQSGFRAIRRSFLKDVGIVSNGFEVETELLLKALMNGSVVEEIPLDTSKRRNGHSHLHPLGDGLKIMRVVLKSSPIVRADVR